MSNGQAGQGTGKPLSTASMKNAIKKSEKEKSSADVSDVSFDISFDTSSVSIKSIDELKNMFINQISLVRAELQGEIDALTKVVEKKDVALAKLNQELGALRKEVDILKSDSKDVKEGLNFVSKETTDIQETINTTASKTAENITFLQEKAHDLEDRSRRNNLVFFNIPEAADKNARENCNDLITDILIRQGMVNKDTGNLFDRAHRLGPAKSNQTRPRPVIVRVTFYLDKVHILKMHIS